MVEGQLVDVQTTEKNYLSHIKSELAKCFRPNDSTYPLTQFKTQWRVTADMCAKYLTAQGKYSRLVDDDIPYLCVYASILDSSINNLVSPKNQIVGRFINEDYQLLFICPVSSNLVPPKKK